MDQDQDYVGRFYVDNDGNTVRLVPEKTLRDYFAGQAMCEMAWHRWPKEEAAQVCYQIADAMLRERDK